MPNLIAQLKVYSSFVKNAFLRLLAYRLRYFTGIFTYLIFVSVHFFIWQAIYSGKPEGATINGFSLPEMITYVAVGWIARSFYFSSVDQEIDDMVRTGQITVYLLRPVNFQLTVVAYAFGQSLFRLLFFSVPIGIVILWLFPVLLPESRQNVVCFVISTIAGALILVQINFLIGLLAFALKSTQGVIRAKYYLVQLCSGLLLPITFFPSWLQSVLDILPFQIIAYVPLRFYLGKVPSEEIVWIFANQLFWVALLTFAGCYFWSKAIDRLTFQGG